MLFFVLRSSKEYFAKTPSTIDSRRFADSSANDDKPSIVELVFFIRRINDSAAAKLFPRAVPDAIISSSVISVASIVQNWSGFGYDLLASAEVTIPVSTPGKLSRANWFGKLPNILRITVHISWRTRLQRNLSTSKLVARFSGKWFRLRPCKLWSSLKTHAVFRENQGECVCNRIRVSINLSHH